MPGTQILQRTYHSFIRFTYPPLCLHCDNCISDPNHVFCLGCNSLLTLIDSSDRCVGCFSQLPGKGPPLCMDCSQRSSALNKVASAFDYLGPAATLVKLLKYGSQPYLAEGGGSFLTTQLLQLGWPLPDLIIPVPQTMAHWLRRGYNQSLLLAKQMGDLLDRPVKSILKRKSGDYSQAGLDYHQRLKLSPKNFKVKGRPDLADKCLLLVDDVMTTGKTLECCAEVLRENCPSKVYGITLCRTT